MPLCRAEGGVGLRLPKEATAISLLASNLENQTSRDDGVLETVAHQYASVQDAPAYRVTEIVLERPPDVSSELVASREGRFSNRHIPTD